jgi:5-deoxy-glucuronate isomerase
MRYTADNLLVHPAADPRDPDLVQRITPRSAGWDYIHFEVRRLAKDRTWSFAVTDFELAFVDLCGRFSIESSRGRWTAVGGRRDVFQGGAHALYLPRQTEFTVTAEESGEFAVAWVPTDRDHAPFLIRPDRVSRSIRGGDNVSRQINDLLPPGSPVHRLVLVEVYTPGGNWSSYPPHKHDRHIEGPDGALLEADLEEVYFYQLQPEGGFAYQWVYTDERSPLHQAGQPIDALVRPGHNCAVLIPEGYHPVVSMPGYTTYYLNVLAGSAQSLANQDDPRFSWVKQTYRDTDKRLPLY